MKFTNSIVASVSCKSVFRRFAELSQREQNSIVERIKEKLDYINSQGEEGMPPQSEESMPPQSEESMPSQSEESMPSQSEESMPPQSEESMPPQSEEGMPSPSGEGLSEKDIYDIEEIYKLQNKKGTESGMSYDEMGMSCDEMGMSCDEMGMSCDEMGEYYLSDSDIAEIEDIVSNPVSLSLKDSLLDEMMREILFLKKENNVESRDLIRFFNLVLSITNSLLVKK